MSGFSFRQGQVYNDVHRRPRSFAGLQSPYAASRRKCRDIHLEDCVDDRRYDRSDVGHHLTKSENGWDTRLRIWGSGVRISPGAPPTFCKHELISVSYTHLRAHETDSYLVCRLL